MLGSLWWGTDIAPQACLQMRDRASSAQGINRLELVFQQLVIASLAVSMETLTEVDRHGLVMPQSGSL